MPKYLALTPQQAAEVKQFGAEPADYVYEVDTGEAVPKAEVPTAWTEEIGSGLKSLLPGLADVPLAPFSLAGQVSDLVRQGVGTYDPNNPSELTKFSKWAKEGVVDLLGEPDPRASWLSTGVGRGLGNLLGMVTPTALGKKAVSKAAELGATSLAGNLARNLPAVTANRLAGGLGGSMMAESTIDREMQQQADAGVQDPLKTALKGLVSGAGGGYLESKLGAGSILRNLTKPTGSLGGRLGRGLAEFGKGGVTEGLQQGLENFAVTEGSLQLGDSQYDPIRAGIVGGLVQGPASVALDALAGKPKVPAEGTPAPAGEKLTGVAGLKTGRAGKPAVEVTPLDTSTKIPAILEARRKKLDYDPPTKDPVHKLVAKLPEEMPLDEAMLKSLYDTWGGDEKNMPKVEAAAQKLYDDYVTTAPVKPLKTVDLVSARLKVRKNYEGVRSTLQKNIADLNKKDEDIQKFNAENPTAIGTITQNQQELARNAALRKEYEGQLVELTNQEMLELSAAQPVLPTRGMESPNTGIGIGAGEVSVPRTGQPSVEISDNSVAPTPAPPAPTKPKVAPRGTADPAVAAALQGYAEEAGGVGASVPMDPARAKALAEQRAQQEGEQGSPFGEQARYSSFGPTPETLRAFASALRAVGTRLTYGIRKETTTEPGFVLSWSNGDESWYVNRGGSYRKDFEPLPNAYDPAFYAKRKTWLDKYGKLSESWKLPKGANIELDANNIFIPAKSKAEAAFIAESLPPHPLYVGSSEYRERSGDTEGKTTANWLAAQLSPNSSTAKDLREAFGDNIGALKPDEQKAFDAFLDKYNKLKEDKQEGSLFGAQTRYSGIPWKEFMQLARRGREGLHAMRPRYSGYQPASSVDAANNLDLFKEGSAVQDVVYHVTTAPMGIKNDIFDVGANKDELGAHFGTLDTIGNLKRRHKSVIKQEDAQVYPVHLSIQNPVWLPDIFPLSDWARDIQSAKANLDAAGTPIDAQNLIIDWLQRKAEGTVDSTQDLRIGLQKLGYDGARYVNAAEGGGESWIAFNPRQIKSATGNVGTFDEKNPSIMYSGIPPAQLKWVDDLFKSLGLKNLGNFDPAYAMSKSVTSRMATRGPSGGLVKWLFADMTREKQKIANVLMEMTAPFREFVNTENGIKWINRASTDETWDDYSGLSKEEIPAAEAYGQFWSDLRDLITDRGVYVMEIDPVTGKVTPRPGAKLPGYTPWAVGDHIYEMAGDKNREAEWKQAQEDFVEKWKEKFGEGSDEMARTAIANLLGVKGMETGPGGEPLFGPVSLPHGMTLPESWRDKRPADSLNRYIRRVSQHLAWAEKVQYNPAARRVFNIKADPMGVDTSKTDPTTWAEAPEAWAYAVREGKRVRADWALNADEKNPPDEPIDFAGDSANMNALLSSFKQASSPNPNLQAFSSAASAALMQAPTGLRDVGMSLVRAAQYAGPSAALRASMDYIANIPAKLREARQAGAMPGDLLEPEIVANSKAIARAMMKLARKLRTWSGREFLDNTGRVIIYDSVKSVIMEGNGDHLVQEFGPAYTEGMSKEEIANQTAAVLSHRASNVSDAGSLPAGMLPQGGGLSAPLSLMRWSVAQYNTFAEDVVNPMLSGKGEEGMKRFLTLVLGSVVAGSVVNGLLDDLLKRKPDHLTWGEWLNVYNDPNVDKATKAKEFAYAAASRAQVMGALGWVGDYLVAPAAREIAGGTRWANQTDIQYPAWIVGNQMAQTIGSYYNAVMNKRTDGRDFLDFLLEMGKINQNVRVAHSAIKNMQGEEKKGLRDQGVVERIYGVNSSTGKPAALETGMGPVFRSDPFNFTRQAMGSEDLGKLEGFLESRRKTGNVPSLDTWSQDRRYYNALERLIGEAEAKKRREVDRKMDQEVRKKNREIRRLSR